MIRLIRPGKKDLDSTTSRATTCQLRKALGCLQENELEIIGLNDGLYLAYDMYGYGKQKRLNVIATGALQKACKVKISVYGDAAIFDKQYQKGLNDTRSK